MLLKLFTVTHLPISVYKRSVIAIMVTKINQEPSKQTSFEISCFTAVILVVDKNSCPNCFIFIFISLFFLIFFFSCLAANNAIYL